MPVDPVIIKVGFSHAEGGVIVDGVAEASSYFKGKCFIWTL